MLVTNAQALGTEYISELVDHGSRACGLDSAEPKAVSGALPELTRLVGDAKDQPRRRNYMQ